MPLCPQCGTPIEREGQLHGCLKGNYLVQCTFPSLRNPLPKNYIEKKIAEYERRCEHEAEMLGAALWMWLREQLENWSEQHDREAHMLFRQGNGVEVLWVNDVQIDTYWTEHNLDKDDERRKFLPLVEIMDQLSQGVGVLDSGIPMGDLEIRAGKLVPQEGSDAEHAEADEEDEEHGSL